MSSSGSTPALARPVVVVAALAAAATGCTEFATPAELTKPTVLAVIADPPIVAPGEAASLAPVVAGPEGFVDPEVTWALVETLPGVPPFGEVIADGDTAIYRAPDEVPPQPEGAAPVASVAATVRAGDVSVTVIKAMVVLDVGAPAANPTITALTIDGAPVGEAATITAGQPHEVAVEVDPPLGEDASVAWYANAGGIERYQSTPTELVAADAPRDGWLFVVVRDGRGGVAVRGLPVAVE